MGMYLNGEDTMPRRKENKVKLLQQSEITARAGVEALDPMFREIIHQSPISTWISDSSGTLIYENTANRRMFGIDSDDQVVGKYNLFKDPVLEEQGLLPKIKEVFEEGLAFETTIDYDFSKVTGLNIPHATHKYLRVFIFPIKDSSGKVQFAVIQHEDYTEKHKAEESLQIFRHATESSVDGILMTDSEGGIIYANPASAEMFRRSREDLQQSITSLCEDSQTTKDLINEVLRTGKWKGELICRRADGASFIMDTSVSTISLPGQDTVNILFICRDVTMERQAEESRRRMEDFFKEQQRQFYKQTIRAATGGKLSILEPDEIERLPGEIIEEYEIREPPDIGEARHRISSKAVRLGLAQKRAENLALCCGEAATNALKHAGGGTVALLKHNNRLMVRVEDHGPGMDALILPRATLELGYSTGRSLGMGYAVILALADEVSLNTGPTGTTVIISMDIKKPVEWPSVESLPDTW